MKEIERNNPVRLAEQVNYDPEKVVFKTIGETKHGAAMLVAAENGQSIAEHHVDALAVVTVLEGKVNFVVEGSNHAMAAGDSIVLAPGTKHSLEAAPAFKLVLCKINS